MSISLANVNSTTDTFQSWLDKTNQVLDKMSNIVVTSAANTTGGQTSGNVMIVGTFAANTISAVSDLRGGTVNASANLIISSNASFTGTTVAVSANASINAMTFVVSANTTTIQGNNLIATANVNVKNNTLTITSPGRVAINATSADAALTVTGTANVSGNVVVGGVITLNGLVSAQSNVTISSGGGANGFLFFGNTGSRTLSYDGSQYAFAIANVAVQGTLIANAITAAANVTLGSGVYVIGDITGNANTLSRSVTAGSYMSGGGTLTSNITLNANASSAATASVLVARDANGSFSANAVTVNNITISSGTLTSNVSGTITQSNNILFGGTAYPGATAATATTVALRDGSGNLTTNLFIGTATAARYADLAEMYLADQDYPVGTVVKIGGSKEVTAYTAIDYIRALGTISDKPAYLMNKDLEGGVPVALKGRVPVRVIGPVKKGQGLGASALPGVATMNITNYFGVALEDYLEYTEGLVEAVIL